MTLCILLDASSVAGPEDDAGGASDCSGKYGQRITGRLDGATLKVALEQATSF